MDRELIQSLAKDFESYAIEIDGVECWFARDLQTPLGYDKWENFYNVIQKAKIACENAGNIIDDHFRDVRKMVDIGSQATREIDKKTSKSWRDGLIPKTRSHSIR